jgi:four helix bundle protein
MEDKIQSYFDLNVWKKSHQIVLDIYKITGDFPENERATLVDQLKRTATNAVVCISDGFQKRNRQDKSRLYIDAQNYLNELFYLALLCKDLGYIQEDTLSENINEVQRMLSGLIRSVLGINKNNNFRREHDTDGMIAKSDIDDVDML